MYIINGVIYANTKDINDVLEHKGLNNLLGIDILVECTKAKLIYCQPIRDVVIIAFATKKMIKRKRKLPQDAKRLLLLSTIQQIMTTSINEPICVGNNILDCI